MELVERPNDVFNYGDNDDEGRCGVGVLYHHHHLVVMIVVVIRITGRRSGVVGAPVSCSVRRKFVCRTAELERM